MLPHVALLNCNSVSQRECYDMHLLQCRPWGACVAGRAVAPRVVAGRSYFVSLFPCPLSYSQEAIMHSVAYSARHAVVTRPAIWESLEPRRLLSAGFVETRLVSDIPGFAAHTD